jgi:D-3-phosphoglycerate dehydrogenase
VAEQLRVTLATLDEIFEQADYITLHTPLTKDTRHLISEAQLKRCKKGVRIINCARGGLVDEAALADAIRSGHVAGAALDVFEEEPPPKDHPLLALDDVICTPHLGAYTTEAQEQVTRQIAEQVLDALNGQPVPNAVNMPSIDPQLFDAIRPYLMLAERIGSLMVQLSRGRLQRISIEYQGEILEYATSPMTASLLKGAIAELTDDPVTMVNAPLFARKRGVQIDEVRSGHHPDYANLMTVSCETDEGSSSYMATIFGRQDVRLVRMDGFEVKAKLEGDMLFCCNEDAPGVVGWMGTLLSDAGVNIADMALGRERRGGRAIMVLNIDAPVPDEAMEKIRSVEHVLWATQVTI